MRVVIVSEVWSRVCCATIYYNVYTRIYRYVVRTCVCVEVVSACVLWQFTNTHTVCLFTIVTHSVCPNYHSTSSLNDHTTQHCIPITPVPHTSTNAHTYDQDIEHRR